MATYNGQDKRLQFLFDMVSNFAPIYSNMGTYAVGAYTIYQGVLYKCITAVTVAEDFDPTKWTQVLVMNEISSGGGGGTTVIANPAGASTAGDLLKLQVGQDIYDIPSGGGGGSVAYVDNVERVIGTWNGATLYEKIVTISALPNVAYTSRSYSHGVSNIDKIFKWQGFVVFASGSVAQIPAGQFNSGGFINYASFYASVSPSGIDIIVGMDRSSASGRFIIQYTKTV